MTPVEWVGIGLGILNLVLHSFHFGKASAVQAQNAAAAVVSAAQQALGSAAPSASK